ncbi:MAG: VanW family protein [Abditibacteriales bacterium]|nr:VanW family protein [Abditibacteriales bacterium]MDW8365612.1 VanW family protein [Abditibacteriales bacterium]
MKQQLPWKGFVVGALALGLCSMIAGIGSGLMDNHRICRGVHVNGVDVGGLTPEQARVKLQAALSGQLHQPATLRYNHLRWKMTPRKIGIAFDFPATAARAHRIGKEGSWWEQLRTRLNVMRHGRDVPPTLVMGAQTPRYFQSLTAVVNKPPVNAEAVLQGNAVRIVPERLGVTLDVEETARRVLAALGNGRRDVPIELAVKTSMPQVTARDLADLNVVLAAYSTRFNPAKRNRTHNLRLAARHVDKTLIPPGDTFSYNTTIGPRLEERGYKPAPIFANNEIVQEVGGGICQVATTVYNAALLSGLVIRARMPHSRPVDYAPRGRDATVYYGQQDLKFTNPFAHAIYLRAKVSGNKVTVWVLGNAADKQDVQIVQTQETRIPAGVVKVADPQLPPGKEVAVKSGRSGYRVTIVRRMTTPQGMKQESFSSYYPPQNAVVRVGVASPQAGVLDAPPKVPAASDLAG